MFETNNSIRQKDLEELIQNPVFEEFKNSTIMVTGATGLIGSEIVLAFLCANRLKSLNTKIIALVRNLEKAKKIFSCQIDNSNLKIIEQDINNPIEYNENVDYVIHTANTTSSKEMLTNPVETINTIVNGTNNILEFAKTKMRKSFCYLSSLEVYGNIISELSIGEDCYGKIDLSNPRSCYPEGKRLAEVLCTSYALEYELDIKIARLTQTFGAGVDINDNRVFAQFAKSVIKNEDIVLHTDGSSLKNYCYITDAVSGILTLLSKGKSGEAYNIANPQTAVSIKDMAQMLSKKYNTQVKFCIDNKNRGYADKYVIKLSSEKLERLGWQANIGLDEMFEKLIESLRGSINEL